MIHARLFLLSQSGRRIIRIQSGAIEALAVRRLIRRPRHNGLYLRICGRIKCGLTRYFGNNRRCGIFHGREVERTGNHLISEGIFSFHDGAIPSAQPKVTDLHIMRRCQHRRTSSLNDLGFGVRVFYVSGSRNIGPPSQRDRIRFNFHDTEIGDRRSDILRRENHVARKSGHPKVRHRLHAGMIFRPRNETFQSNTVRLHSFTLIPCSRGIWLVASRVKIRLSCVVDQRARLLICRPRDDRVVHTHLLHSRIADDHRSFEDLLCLVIEFINDHF